MENITWWHIYLFTRLDVIKDIITPIAIISFICFIGLIIANYVSEFNMNYHFTKYGEKDRDYLSWQIWNNLWKRFIHIFVLPVSLLCIITPCIPTQKEFAAIYLIPKITKSDFAKEASKLPEGIVKTLNIKLEQWQSDMLDIKEKNK